MEQALFLPEDMADLRSLRKHKVFLSLKKDLAMAIQAAHRAKEIVISSHKMMKEKEGRCTAAMKAFELAEKKSQDLTTKLEAQHKLFCQAADDLTAARSQIKVLTKKLKEAEKAKEQAEQEGYDVGVTKTEVAFRAEVTQVCRFYYLLVWNEALDQARVKASSALRRAENMYYPPAICISGSSGSKVDLISLEVDKGKANPSKAPPIANISSKEAGQAEDTKKLGDTTKEMAYDVAMPPVAPKDPSKEKETSQGMEVMLETLPIPPKEDLKGQGQASTTTASTQPPKNPKDKLISPKISASKFVGVTSTQV
nr:hypothetical protein CFP56_46373 [Quercus suber]